MTRARNPWIGLGFDAWRLSIEASAVIAQRSLKLAAGGPAANAEATRMIAEKIDAGIALQAKALRGELGLTPAAVTARSLAHYRRKVRANHRRLTKT